MTGLLPVVASRFSGRALTWIGMGILGVIASLCVSGVSAWMMIHAADSADGDRVLLAIACLLLALLACFLGCLSWLAVDHGRHHRRSTVRHVNPLG